MSRTTNLKLAALLAVVTSLIVFAWPRHARIIGNLSPEDAGRIKQLAWNHVRPHELPTFDWDSLSHPRYLFDGIARYSRLRILWIEAARPHYARVVIGLGTNTIATDGHSLIMQEFEGRWKITGGTYWGSPEAMPEDVRLIPSACYGP